MYLISHVAGQSNDAIAHLDLNETDRRVAERRDSQQGFISSESEILVRNIRRLLQEVLVVEPEQDSSRFHRANVGEGYSPNGRSQPALDTPDRTRVISAEHWQTAAPDTGQRPPRVLR